MAGELQYKIIDVWKDNLEAEVNNIKSVLNKGYPFIATDTEFPGKPLKDKQVSDYTNMKSNVDELKIIQIGLTLVNEDGNLPELNGEHPVWQFNFCEFDICKDVIEPDSLKVLTDARIDFNKNMTFGITAKEFAEVIRSSGLVSNDTVQTRLVTFHGGYDCGYWIRLLSGDPLPDNEAAFYEMVNAYFPVFYDLKHVAIFCEGIDHRHGLARMAKTLNVKRRAGTPHQAGPDSLHTSGLYQALKNKFFANMSMLHDGVLFFL